ncbi:efflux RND transporter periplasmic adaptor subunit [Marinicella rhabdoformis]|uniref:efflux RND transporter periplasmic adaptor subunit n=1 Tax=Marinicella rhabdoformis TaxID=2580566 RepID=UPI001C554485|nr:efflux RND transporter periplasmic adaptor subunit [Marinicella rhabdoformis]
MKNKVITVAMLMLVSAGVWYYQSGQDDAASVTQQMASPMKVSVTAHVVQTELVDVKMSFPGRTVAFQQSQVRPQVTGIITKRMFKEGALVVKGQQLYQLDDARYEANLKSAQANLQSAKASFKSIQARLNRVKSLVGSQAVSQQDLEDVEAQFDQAKAAIAVAEAAVSLEKINLDYTRVYAPISGRIGKSNVTVGALVTASQSAVLTTITQLNPIYVDMQVSGDDLQPIQKHINSNEQVSVQLKGYDTEHGELIFSAVTVDENTGSVALRAKLNNQSGHLLPGLFVNAEVSLGMQNHILVPQRATTRNPNGDLQVWVISPDNTVNSRIIKADQAHNDHWIVTQGLEAGERVVIEGYQRLTPGAEVDFKKWVQPGKANLLKTGE